MPSDLTPEFETLFLTHHQTLVNISYNILRDRESAEDVVQEVFEKLWKNKEGLTMGDRIDHYLFKATAHISLNHLRWLRKRYRLDDIDPLRELVAQGGTDSVGYKEFELKTRQAIDRLPPQCKTIFLLSRHEGLKYSDIASTLGISLSAVENQMGIALKKLRADLKPFLTLDIISLIITLASLLYLIFL